MYDILTYRDWMRRLSIIRRSYFPSNGLGKFISSRRLTFWPGFAKIIKWSGWLIKGFNWSLLQSTRLFSIASTIWSWLLSYFRYNFNFKNWGVYEIICLRILRASVCRYLLACWPSSLLLRWQSSTSASRHLPTLWLSPPLMRRLATVRSGPKISGPDWIFMVWSSPVWKKVGPD